MENFKFALRYLLKLRGGNLTRILSLALGLAVGIVIFSYGRYVLTFDRCYPEGERIYQLWSRGENGLWPQQYAPMAGALRDEIPAVESATRLAGTFKLDFFVGHESFPLICYAVDTAFFDVLGFELLRGDPHAVFGDRDRMMLSESAARRLFGDEDPVGRSVIFRNERPMTVSGIFRDPPRNTHLGSFQGLVSIEMLRGSYYMGWGGGDSFPTYIKLGEGASIGEVSAAMPALCERHGIGRMLEKFDQEYLFFPVRESAYVGSALASIAYMLLSMAFLVVVVSALNYVLISISTLVSRTKTIAMLKVGGALRRDIFCIFLYETALLVLAAAAVGIFIDWALYPYLRTLMAFDFDFADLFAPGRLWVIVAVVAAAFLVAALLPAQLFTSVPVTAAFRGRPENRRFWARGLLFVQVASITLIFSFLLIATLQFRMQQKGDFGFDHEKLYYCNLEGTRPMFRNYAESLAAMPEVEAAGVTLSLPLWGYSGQPCYDENTRVFKFHCRVNWIDENYLGAMNIPLVAGRGFSAAEGGANVLVNETYLAMRGWTPQEAVGRQIADKESPESPLYTVIGVVEDFRTNVVDGDVAPLVLHHLAEYYRYGGGPDAIQSYHMMIRLRELSPEAVAAVKERIGEFRSPDNHVLTRYDDMLHDMLDDDRQFRNTVYIVGIIVTLIGLMGLVGYLNDEIRRRRKEIALRRVHGATQGAVQRLLAGELAWIVVPAIAVGVAGGYYTGDLWLESFDARIRLAWWIFALAAATVAAVVAAVQLHRTRKIAGANPAEMIQTE